jgi:protein O-GlcNAc transferase
VIDALLASALLLLAPARGHAASQVPQQQAPPQPATRTLSPPADAETLLAQAVELHQAGDILGAIAAYEAALKLQPDNAGAHSNLGAALVRLGRYDEGVTHYQRALALDPANTLFRFNLALALYKSGDAPAAVPELQKVLAAKDQRNARVLLGDCYLRMGRFQEAVDLLSPYERELGDDRAFSYVLGSAYVETNRPDDAQRVINRIFNGGESAEGHLLMATAYLRQADGPAAVTELKRALAINPQLPVANALLGRALLRSGDQEAALRAFRRELELNPNDFDANLEVGELKKRDQQFEDALIYIQRARRMRPTDASAGFSLAGVYVSTGKPEEARQILEQVVKDKPKYAEAAVLLATVYYRLNRKADGDRMRAVVEQLNAEAQTRNQKVKD